MPDTARLRVGAVRRRIATSFAGLFLCIYGAIAALSPLPTGAPLLIFGILLIALANPRARPFVRRMRRRVPVFDAIVRALGPRAGRDVKALIEETDPQ